MFITLDPPVAKLTYKNEHQALLVTLFSYKHARTRTSHLISQLFKMQVGEHDEMGDKTICSCGQDSLSLADQEIR